MTQQVTVDQAIGIAVQHHQAGRLGEAETIYRQVLAHQPRNPDALHLLGVIAFQVGKLDLAAELLNNSISLRPNFADAHNNLGNVLKAQGKFDAAVAAYLTALKLKPDSAEGHNNLANAFLDQGKLDSAVAAYQRAIQLAPNFAMAHSNLGNVLTQMSRLDEAVAACQRAVQLQPDFADAHFHLGNALKDQGQVAQAIAAYSDSVRLRPDYSPVHNNLGAMYREAGRLDDAEAEFQKAIQCDPRNAPAYNNLGNSLKDRGELDQAIACYHRTLELAPFLAQAHSNLAYTLLFHPDYDAAAILEEQRRWDQQHGQPFKEQILPHLYERDPNRKLRIGYVSPDFRSQAEAYFVLPLLENHDHAGFEVHCYSSVILPDELTERHRKAADHWHDVRSLGHEELAKKIRADGIDILIDLTMHMANSRLPMFARKPAPVQVTWLAYPGGTGLEAMDYRLTDPLLDPPDIGDEFYVEKSIRLPDCWCCYDPLSEAPPAAPRPEGWSGPILFGSLNNPCKLSAPTLKLWAQVLDEVEDSRLLLLVNSTRQRQRVTSQLEQLGFDTRRLEYVGYLGRSDYLRLYDRIDIALDPLPYNGITTTCDALWMGVPVVSLAGRTAAGRAGLGMLTSLGLSNLAAHSPVEFLAAAVGLARDPHRLSDLRSTLRQRMQASPLMDGLQFARNVELAYRRMWQRWCEGGTQA
jgi:predicted O-linked N-acetylglucosamine transferase (SPINDLY family)